MAGGTAGGQADEPMKLPDDQTHGAEANEGLARANPEPEPLFGDERWIAERLRALRTPMTSAETRAAV